MGEKKKRIDVLGFPLPLPALKAPLVILAQALPLWESGAPHSLGSTFRISLYTVSVALVPRAGKGTRHRSVAALEPQASPLLYLPDTQHCPIQKHHTKYIIIPQLHKFRPNPRLLETQVGQQAMV